MPTVKKEGLASVLTLDAKQVLEAMRNLVEAQRAQADRDDWNAFQERKKKRLEAEKEKDNAYYWNIFQERKRESLEAAIDGMYVSTQKKRRLEAEIESAAMKEVDALRQKREKKKKNEKMKLASSCEEVWISKKVAIDESQLVQLCDERFATSLGSVFSCNKGHNKYGRTFHTIEQCYHCKHNIWRSHLAGMQCVSMQDAETYMHDAIHASEDTPLKLGNAIWLFKGFYYTVEGIYTDDEFRLLILEDFDTERRHFERLKQKHDSAEQESTQSRVRLPEQVRIEVWRRDNGKCARCESRENLEYDHIIPFSKGGGNTTRNIELLCEKCNRSKGANIS